MTDLAPELHLLRAMLRQVEADSMSPEPAHRVDVQRWLSAGELTWWDAFLGCDGALERTLRQRLGTRLAQHRPQDRHQLALPFVPTEIPFWGLSASADRGKKGWPQANSPCLCQEADKGR